MYARRRTTRTMTRHTRALSRKKNSRSAQPRPRRPRVHPSSLHLHRAPTCVSRHEAAESRARRCDAGHRAPAVHMRHASELQRAASAATAGINISTRPRAHHTPCPRWLANVAGTSQQRPCRARRRDPSVDRSSRPLPPPLQPAPCSCGTPPPMRLPAARRRCTKALDELERTRRRRSARRRRGR